MSNYTRCYSAGGCYFFTVVTHRRQLLFQDAANVALLRQAFRQVKARYPFDIDAIVILPDHLHCIWRLPPGDDDFSNRWRYIKTEFSQSMVMPVNARGEKSVWQRRFWEHCICNEKDWRNHMDYIFYNPVKHGLARSVDEWPFSSFGQAVRKGWYPNGWGRTEPESIVDIDLE